MRMSLSQSSGIGGQGAGSLCSKGVCQNVLRGEHLAQFVSIRNHSAQHCGEVSGSSGCHVIHSRENNHALSIHDV